MGVSRKTYLPPGVYGSGQQYPKYTRTFDIAGRTDSTPVLKRLHWLKHNKVLDPSALSILRAEVDCRETRDRYARRP